MRFFGRGFKRVLRSATLPKFWAIAASLFGLTFAFYVWESARAVLGIDSVRLAREATKELENDRPDVAAVLAAKALPSEGFQIQLTRKWREEPAIALYQAQSSTIGLKRYAVSFPPDSQGQSYEGRLDVLGISEDEANITVTYGPRRTIYRPSASLVVVKMARDTGIPSPPIEILWEGGSGKMGAASSDGALIALSDIKRWYEPLRELPTRPVGEYLVTTCIYKISSAELIGSVELRTPERRFKLWLGGTAEKPRVVTITKNELRTAGAVKFGDANCPVAKEAPHMNGVLITQVDEFSLLKSASYGEEPLGTNQAFQLSDRSRSFKNQTRFVVNRGFDRFVETGESEYGIPELRAHCVAAGEDHRSFNLRPLADHAPPRSELREGDEGSSQGIPLFRPTAATFAENDDILVGNADGAIALFTSPWSRENGCGDLSGGVSGSATAKIIVSDAGAAIEAIGVSADSGRIAYATFKANADDYESYTTYIHLRNKDDWPIRQVLEHGYEAPARYLFSPSGEELLIEFSDRSFEIWRVNDGAVMHQSESGTLDFGDEFGLDGTRWLGDGEGVGFLSRHNDPFVLWRSEFRTRISAPIKSALKDDENAAPGEALLRAGARRFLMSVTPTGGADSEVIVAPQFDDSKLYRNVSVVGQFSPVGVDPVSGSISRVFRYGSEAPPNEGVYSVALLKASHGDILAASSYDVGRYVRDRDASGRVQFWRLDNEDEPIAKFITNSVTYLRASENAEGLLAVELDGSAHLIAADQLIELQSQTKRKPDFEAVCEDRNANFDHSFPASSFLVNVGPNRNKKLKAIFVCYDGAVLIGSEDQKGLVEVLSGEKAQDKGDDESIQRIVTSDFDPKTSTLAIALGTNVRLVSLDLEKEIATSLKFDVATRPGLVDEDQIETVEQIRIASAARSWRDIIPGMKRKTPRGVYLIDADRTIHFADWDDIEVARNKNIQRHTQLKNDDAQQADERVGKSVDLVNLRLSRFKTPNFLKSSYRENRELLLFEDDFATCGAQKEESRLLLVGNVRQIELFSPETGASYDSIRLSSSRLGGAKYATYGLDGRTMAYLPPTKGGSGDARIAIGLNSNEVLFHTIPPRSCKTSSNDLRGLLEWRRTLSLYERQHYEVDAYSDYPTWVVQKTCSTLDYLIRAIEPQNARTIEIDVKNGCKSLGTTMKLNISRISNRLASKPDDATSDEAGDSNGPPDQGGQRHETSK